MPTNWCKKESKGRKDEKKKMKRNRIMIAAPKSGSGKTMITCGLLQALLDREEKVLAYKCGPDYIDPMFHRRVLGIPGRNLDTFFTGEEKTRELFLESSTEGSFCVMEGVMGLFDGLGGIREEGSSYHLAKVTRTPILLVVDAKGMGRSVLALLAGFLTYDEEKLIKGVLFNRMTKGYYEILKPLIEEELHLPVVGYLPEQKELTLESRHLGLLMPGEVENLQDKMKRLAEVLTKTVDMEKVLQIGRAACDLRGDTKTEWTGREEIEPTIKIAVARDEAFCFYYEENLKLLEELGAELVYFSPLWEKELPKDVNGLLLGGGYPELYAEALSANESMRESIKKAVEGGMPTLAECGGFLYLHETLESKEEVFPMAGVLPGKGFNTGKLVRFGYIEIEEKQSSFLPPGEKIRGHEFHYYDTEYNGEDCRAIKPVTGRSYPCIVSNKTCFLGFPHLYYPSNPDFVGNFIKKAKEYGV